MLHSLCGRRASGLFPLDESLSEEKRLDAVFDGLECLAQLRGNRLQARGPPLFGQETEHTTRDRIQPSRIDANLLADVQNEQVPDLLGTVASESEIANPARNPEGDSRRALRTSRDLLSAFRREVQAHFLGRALHNGRKLFQLVGPQFENVAEALAHGLAEFTLVRCGSDDGESLERHAVEVRVLHHRVEHLLHRALERMDLVDEQNVAALATEDGDLQLVLVLEGRCVDSRHVTAHVASESASESGLAETSGTAEEHVLDGLVPGLCRGHVDLQILADFVLTEAIRDGLRPKRPIKLVSRRLHNPGYETEIGIYRWKKLILISLSSDDLAPYFMANPSIFRIWTSTASILSNMVWVEI